MKGIFITHCAKPICLKDCLRWHSLCFVHNGEHNFIRIEENLCNIFALYYIGKKCYLLVSALCKGLASVPADQDLDTPISRTCVCAMISNFRGSYNVAK